MPLSYLDIAKGVNKSFQNKSINFTTTLTLPEWTGYKILNASKIAQFIPIEGNWTIPSIMKVTILYRDEHYKYNVNDRIGTYKDFKITHFINVDNSLLFLILSATEPILDRIPPRIYHLTIAYRNNWVANDSNMVIEKLKLSKHSFMDDTLYLRLKNSNSISWT